MAIRTLRSKYRERTIRTRAVLIEWRYARYESITFHTSYITYHPVPSVQNVLLGTLNNQKNGHSCVKIAESAIPHRITMKNSIQVDQRNKNGWYVS